MGFLLLRVFRSLLPYPESPPPPPLFNVVASLRSAKWEARPLNIEEEGGRGGTELASWLTKASRPLRAPYGASRPRGQALNPFGRHPATSLGVGQSSEAI